MLIYLLIQAFWLWAVVHAQSPSSEHWNPCPGEPQCSCWSNKVLTKVQTIVACNNRNLTKVPTELPYNTVLLNLNDNTIKSLGNGSFKGYPGLRTLTVAQNNITQIIPGAFEGLQKLAYLSLRNNSIRYNCSGFQPGIFKPLVNLEKLNIQQNFTRNDYRGENYDLEALTDLVKLKILFLDGMPEQNLGKVFTNLTSLREIKFNGKWGRCLIWNMTPNIFPWNTSLTHITIRNCEMKKIQAKSFQPLPHLRYLDLSYNEELTFSSMKNLTDGLVKTAIETLKLNKLHTSLGPCVILTKENLEGLRYLSLKEIYLESNRIATVDKNADRYIPNTLETISMRDNILTIDSYVFNFLARQTFSNLRKFIFADQNRNHYLIDRHGNELQLDKQMIIRTKRGRHPKLLTGSRLSSNSMQQGNYNMKLSNTIYERVTNTVDRGAILGTKTDFNIINDLPIMKRHSGVYDDDKINSAIEGSFTHEETIDNKKEQAEVLKRMIAKWMQGFPITPPKNFTYLDASNNKIRLLLSSYTITEPNNLRELNLSRNLYWAWVGPFEGLGNLTKLDMSWNFCNYMSLTALEHMPKLEILNLSKNYLDTSINYDQKGILFQNQDHLTTLVMAENRLRNLPTNIFTGLKDLKELNLAKNLLKTFEVDLSHMNHLHILNLYDNQLETISESAREVFDRQAKVAKFTLNLERNNFKCDCANLDFLKWISKSPINFENIRNYRCYFKDRTYANLTNAWNIYEQLEEECTNYTAVIVISTSALVLVLSLTAAAVVYRFRWHLRYLYYMSKYKAKASMLRSHGYEPIGTEEDEFKDVNVSYANEDCGFIRQKIYTELEVNRGLRLHLRHRDSPVDERYVCDNIMDAIESTRKTLIIMSKAYLKHRWCIYEMNMAGIKALKTGNNMICVLLLEEVSHKALPLKIMKIIKDQEHIEYPGDDNLHDCFWDRLKAALTD